MSDFVILFIYSSLACFGCELFFGRGDSMVFLRYVVIIYLQSLISFKCRSVDM
jgi:hypothetical protein